MRKVKDEQKYKNIPVKPDVYDRVRLVAEANGFGERGLGAQVAHWVGQELPVCEHEKIPVLIEAFPSQTQLVKSVHRPGYYCETCSRVYAKVSEDDLAAEDGKKLLKAVRVAR